MYVASTCPRVWFVLDYFPPSRRTGGISSFIQITLSSSISPIRSLHQMPYSIAPKLYIISGGVVLCKHKCSRSFLFSIWLDSLNRWETTNLTISYSTPLDIIEKLRSLLQRYIDDNNRDWVSFNLNIDKIEFQNAVWLIIAVQRVFEIIPRIIVTHWILLLRSSKLARLGRSLGPQDGIHATS